MQIRRAGMPSCQSVEDGATPRPARQADGDRAPRRRHYRRTAIRRHHGRGRHLKRDIRRGRRCPGRRSIQRRRRFHCRSATATTRLQCRIPDMPPRFGGAMDSRRRTALIESDGRSTPCGACRNKLAFNTPTRRSGGVRPLSVTPSSHSPPDIDAQPPPARHCRSPIGSHGRAIERRPHTPPAASGGVAARPPTPIGFAGVDDTVAGDGRC